MKDDKILELKEQILNDDVKFINVVSDYLRENRILYSDNFMHSPEFDKQVEYLEPFMHLLYRGSKHSVGSMAESGFTRIVVHNGVNMKFIYYSGPETFVVVEKLEDISGLKPIVTMDLLKERLSEAEEVKSELAPIIEKYLKAGLTFEEITRMFVEIMRENRINI